MNHPLLRPELRKTGVAALFAAVVALPMIGCATDTQLDKGTDANDRDDRPMNDDDAMRPMGSRDGRPGQFTADGTGTVGSVSAKSGEADLQVSKTMPEKIVLGKTMTYNLTVNNPGDAALTGVTVSEALPDGFDFESSTPTADRGGENGQTLMFDLGEVSPGKTQKISITGTPQKAGMLKACTSYDYSRGVCAMIDVVNPSLRLVKQGPANAGLCQAVPYTYVVSNPGQDPAKDVVIYDKLPDGLTVDGEQTVNIPVGTVAPGQEIRKTISVSADRAGSFGSYALARGDLEEFKSENVATTFVAPKLDVAVRANRATEYVGKQAQFAVNVKNSGTVASPQTRLKLDMEGDAAKVTSVRGDNIQGGQGDAASGVMLGALEPGESRNYTVNVNTVAAGRVQLQAIAESVCEDRDQALAKAQAADDLEVQTLSALQVEVVDKTDPVQVGAETVYEITIINEGSGPDTNLQVRAELPEGLSFVRGQGGTAVASDGKSLTMAPVQTLPAGEKVTWYVTVRADSAAGATKFKVFAQSTGVPDAVEEDEPTTLY